MTPSNEELNIHLSACLLPVLDLAGDRPILLAVSGGADSMALAHVMAQSAAAPEQIHWVHVHHGLRGGEADGDAEFVLTAAAEAGVECHLHHVDTRARMAAAGISLEMAARDLRYDVFSELASDIGATVVMTAHTLDDQVETVLMKWARGASPGALAGMKAVSRRAGWFLCRPLLSVRRNTLRDWLSARGLTWREDSSNEDEQMLRNRLRCRLLPAMDEVFGEGWQDQLARQAEIQAEENAWFESRVIQWLGLHKKQVGLDVHALDDEAPAFQRRILHHWLLEQTGQPLLQARWEQVQTLLTSKDGSSGVDLESGWRLVRAYDALTLVREEANANFSEQPLPVPGEITWGQDGVKLCATPHHGFERQPQGMPGTPSIGCINAAKVTGPVVVRAWRNGDRFAVPGMKGHRRKVQDLFTDLKVPQHQRGTIPLVCVGDDIVWIPGYAVNERWLVPGEDAPSVRLELLGEPCVSQSETATGRRRCSSVPLGRSTSE